MRRWSLLALAVILAASVAGYFGTGARVDARAQDYEDYVNETRDRVNDARTLLYPGDRPDAFQGGPEEAADALLAIYDEQNVAEFPDGAEQIHYDLVEAMASGGEALATRGPDAGLQDVFAKSIIYNADAPLLALVETC